MSGYLSPVLFPGATVTSGIGSRSSPGGVGSTNHQGIDIAAPRGTPVYAPIDLTVTRAGWSDSYGNVIYGVDQQGYQYRFAHLDNIGVAQGARVAQGTVLGGVGSTGHSTGNHLHFEVRDKAGKLVKGLTNDIVNAGKGLFDKGLAELKKFGLDIDTGDLLRAVPGVGEVLGVTDLFGITGDCNWLCQLKNWINESDFFKRTAFVVLGLILIIGAIVFFSKGTEGKLLTRSIGKFSGA